MALTLNLGTEVRGDKLAEVVEASMREIGDWQFETKRDAGIVKVYAWISDAYPREICFPGFSYSGTVSFGSIDSSRENKGNVAYCLRKKGDRRYSDLFFTLMVSVLNPILLSTVIEDYKYLVNEEFVSGGSIFTLIHPEKYYHQLELYANAAFDFENPQNSGKVQQVASSQFLKIQPIYDRLVQKIRSRFPQQSPYRSQALVW